MLVRVGKLLLYGGVHVAGALLAASVVVATLYIAVTHHSPASTSTVARTSNDGCMPSHCRAKALAR
jgi:hypothetical protein